MFAIIVDGVECAKSVPFGYVWMIVQAVRRDSQRGEVEVFSNSRGFVVAGSTSFDDFVAFFFP